MSTKNNITALLKNIKLVLSLSFWKAVIHAIYLFTTFFILLILFILDKLFSKLLFMPFVGRLLRSVHFATGNTAAHYNFLTEKLEGMRSSEVKRSYLINLAFKNLLAKKTRSFITIFGMAVGIGIIVFLLSLGYGIERLVIGKVASLNELRMIDVTSSDNTALRLDRTVYNKISAFIGIEKVIPEVSVVGKVTMNGATTDVLVYAVPRSYLDVSEIKAMQGNLFSNNTTFDTARTAYTQSNGQVAGVSTHLEEGKNGVRRTTFSYTFNINPGTFEQVSESCSITAPLLGYTTRIEGGYTGEQYWGSEYAPFDEFGRGGYDKENDQYLGKWIQGEVMLYQKNENGTYTPLLDAVGHQAWKSGCLYERNIALQPILTFHSPEVLGESTSSATLATDAASLAEANSFDAVVVSSDSSGMEMVILDASSSGTTKKVQEKIMYTSPPDGTAVVSTGFLNLLNISIKKALGQSFTSSFIVSQSLNPSVRGKTLTEEKKFKIIGVIEDDNNTYFYIPYGDIKKLGIPNVSQMKVVLKDANAMAKIRKQIETLGFRTNSTVDTVKQIESLFASLRLVLAIVGLVALGVASLGMFNTLTVSLLERTREIGGMKTMGMVSEEVQDLFLAEAMIMGLSGGIGGILFGICMGTALSFIVSVIALSKGQGYLNLTYMPPTFTIFILVSSFVVGVLTGIYPAQRAKKISALNALRYE